MKENGINSDNVFSGDVDPEIADLFGIKDDGPSFDLLFDEQKPQNNQTENKEEIDFSRKNFDPITKFFSDTPAPIFKDK